jgi:DNA (cytosine-5)-methyltransferase 1
MSNYYNEHDPYAAAWLRNLISAGHLPAGEVDERSIVDVAPADLAGFKQCHFFAGIGGWSLATRLAGWPDDRELWTGSAPCQPFSVAGQGKAQADDRHLWPHLFRLVRARRPAVVMGEQVAAAVGKNWLDGVAADLEGIGYACGAVVVPACAVNAPHRRDRLWFVADASGERRQQVAGSAHGNEGTHEGRAALLHHVTSSHGESERNMADTYGSRLERRELLPERKNQWTIGSGGMADANSIGGQIHSNAGGCSPGSGAGQIARLGSAWHGAGWIIGHDGKSRRVEPSIRLLAHGLPSRVGRLRAYGNAIVPQVAAEVIGAYMDCRPAMPQVGKEAA